MRKEKVWLIVHPDEERFFVQPYPPLSSRAKMLREQGYMILVTEVTLPPILDRVEKPLEAQSTPASEVWSRADASDTPHAATELPAEQGTGSAGDDPPQTGVLVRPDAPAGEQPGVGEEVQR